MHALLPSALLALTLLAVPALADPGSSDDGCPVVVVRPEQFPIVILHPECLPPPPHCPVVEVQACPLWLSLHPECL
jgi:hypothetical protein